jgi:SAM-dependent methyltransferase
LTPEWRSPSGRDPDGRLYVHDEHILRAVYAGGVDNVEALLQSSAVRQLIAGGKLVATHRVTSGAPASVVRPEAREQAMLVLEHERVAFPSYPYEWPPEMLFAAGDLTLDLAESLLADGLGLKDATPFNVLFNGPNPVFVDVLSVERRDPTNPVWLPKAQFDRAFILPLLANRYFGISPAQVFLSSRDGLTPEQVYALCGLLRSLTPKFLKSVTLPALLGKAVRPTRTRIYEQRSLSDPERARFVLGFVLRRLRSQLRSISPLSRNVRSTWSDYEQENSYSAEIERSKVALVEDAIRQFGAERVLDVGCNTGRFSLVAAKCGASVVALDSDPVVVGRLWANARDNQMKILPLVMDFARPSAAIGWRQAECMSFQERAAGKFDMVMMLALVHHLLVTERIPLSEIADAAAALTTQGLVVEFVGRDDPMFQALLRGRGKLFEAYSRISFEAAFTRHFHIERSVQLGKLDRRLYLMRRKTGR